MKKLTTVMLFVSIAIFHLSLRQGFGQYPGSNQVPLDPNVIPKFVDPMPHFAGARVDVKTGGNLIAKVAPSKQIALSTGTVLDNGIVVVKGCELGKTKLWTYSFSKDGGKTWTTPNWPGYTIDAQKGYPVNVTYVNGLNGQTYKDLNLTVDQSLMWAAPTVTGNPMKDPYTGPVPTVTHLHGAEVLSESDGGPDSWFTPGYAIVGPAWKQGVDQYYTYPNTQQATTLWYHDHTLAATRLGVYSGLAGMYILRGTDEVSDKLPGWPGDDLVQEVAPAKTSGVYNTKPYLPELELLIQDRMFDTKGQLYFPVDPPNPDVHPFWAPEFFGNVMAVNGKTWPYFSVAPRKYRFRVLNACNARFLRMWLQNLATGANGPVITQIGTDGGLLDSPVQIDPKTRAKLFIAPAERADIVIDFSKVAPGSIWTLMNNALAPFPTGDSVTVGSTDRIMQFVVNGKMISSADLSKSGIDKSAVPASLRSAPIVKLTDFQGHLTTTPAKIRQLVLIEVEGAGGPEMVMLNNTPYTAPVTELPVEGTTEVWQLINTTEDAHPIHIHLIQFQVVGHQAYDADTYLNNYMASFANPYIGGEGPPFAYNVKNSDGAIGGNPSVSSYLQGSVLPVISNERGWKDTYKVLPGEVTTFIVRFAPISFPLSTPVNSLLFPFDASKGPGYVWHCHILDHEDNDMMRPWKIVASPYRTKSAELFAQDELKTNPAEGFYLGHNYPNPFSVETNIQFKVPENIHVQLKLFNIAGQEISTLIDAEAPAGLNTVILSGDKLKEGVYFYTIKAGKFHETKKLMVSK